MWWLTSSSSIRVLSMISTSQVKISQAIKGNLLKNYSNKVSQQTSSKKGT